MTDPANKGKAPPTGARPLAPSAETIRKELDVLRLRRARVSFSEIALQVGYADKGGAHKAYRNALNRIYREPVAETIELESGTLDDLQAAVWRKAMSGDLEAVRTVLRIMERRARLHGLDHADGVAERMVQLEADKTRIMGMALVATLTEVGLDDAQAGRAQALLFDKMRELAVQVGGDASQLPDLDVPAEDVVEGVVEHP